MDSRYKHVRQSSNDRKLKATGDTEVVDSSQLAADRFNQAAGRLKRKTSPAGKQTPPPDRFNTLRLISASIIILTIATIAGIILRNRIGDSPTPTTAVKVPARMMKPADAPTVSLPSSHPPAPDSIRHAPAQGQLPANKNDPRISSYHPMQTSTPAQRSSTARPTTTPKEKSSIASLADSQSAAVPLTDDDDSDIDHTLAFYEPVNRNAKTGSFEIRSGGKNGKPAGRNGTAGATNSLPRRSIARMTASLAISAGGSLDTVLEHNGTYYKVKLTLPSRRIDFFQKSLAAQDGVATLSVTAVSTSGGTSVIILEMNTR